MSTAPLIDLQGFGEIDLASDCNTLRAAKDSACSPVHFSCAATTRAYRSCHLFSLRKVRVLSEKSKLTMTEARLLTVSA